MVGDQAQVVLQARQLGTGHAVLQAAPVLQGVTGTALILCGDTPLLEAGELTKFAEAHEKSGAAATVMTAIMADPFGYGRILRDKDGNVLGIVEQKMLRRPSKRSRKLIPAFTVWLCRSCLRF
jgi:bifunctional UDP-N-acetylglucosamine pyrophosphorylase/glucosamine-1-phosphate N-acetyltransferase